MIGNNYGNMSVPGGAFDPDIETQLKSVKKEIASLYKVKNALYEANRVQVDIRGGHEIVESAIKLVGAVTISIWDLEEMKSQLEDKLPSSS